MAEERRNCKERDPFLNLAPERFPDTWFFFERLSNSKREALLFSFLPLSIAGPLYTLEQ
jgi:hypothetical protein